MKLQNSSSTVYKKTNLSILTYKENTREDNIVKNIKYIKGPSLHELKIKREYSKNDEFLNKVKSRNNISSLNFRNKTESLLTLKNNLLNKCANLNYNTNTMNKIGLNFINNNNTNRSLNLIKSRNQSSNTFLSNSQSKTLFENRSMYLYNANNAKVNKNITDIDFTTPLERCFSAHSTIKVNDNINQPYYKPKLTTNSRIINKNTKLNLYEKYKQHYQEEKQSAFYNYNEVRKESDKKTRLKKILNSLFYYYCNYNETKTFYNLKFPKLVKLAVDAQLLNKIITKAKLELLYKCQLVENYYENSNINSKDDIYYKEKARYLAKSSTKYNDSGVNLISFIEIIEKIAEIKYDENQRNMINQEFKSLSNINILHQDPYVNHLLQENLIPLYEELFKDKINSQYEEEKKTILSKSPNNKRISTRMSVFLNKYSTIISNKIRNSQGNTEKNQNKTVIKNHSHNKQKRISIYSTTNSYDSMFEELLIRTSLILNEIYRTFFPWEVSLSNDLDFLKSSSESQFKVFCKDFNLCPTLLNKIELDELYKFETYNKPGYSDFPAITDKVINHNTYYKEKQSNFNKSTKKSEILGKYFNFYCFLRSLIKISQIGYTHKKNLSNFDKLCLLLESMELSSGFTKFQEKRGYTHTSKYNNIITPETIIDIKNKYQIDKLKPILSSNDNNIAQKDTKFRGSVIFKESFNDRNIEIKEKDRIQNSTSFELNLNDEDFALLNKYSYINRFIYEYYSIMIKNNESIIKHTSFIRFLKDAKLLKLTIIEQEPLYVSKKATYSKNKVREFHNKNGNRIIQGDVNENKKRNLDIAVADNLYYSIIQHIKNNIQNNDFLNRINENRVSNNDYSQNNQFYSKYAENNDLDYMDAVMLSSYKFNNKRVSVINDNTFDFIGFMMSVIAISMFIKSNYDSKTESITKLYDKHIIPLYMRLKMSSKESNNKQHTILYWINSSTQVNDLFRIVNRLYKPIFNYYSGGKVGFEDKIILEKFIKFSTDFQFFPNKISKNKLVHYFNNHSLIYFDDNSFKTSYLDLNNFCIALLDIALYSEMSLITNQSTYESYNSANYLEDLDDKVVIKYVSFNNYCY